MQGIKDKGQPDNIFDVVKYGDIQAVKLLLARGVNVNISKRQLNHIYSTA